MKLIHDLNCYQDRIEQQIQTITTQLGPASPLRDACEYALLSGGKRFRPALVLMIAETLENHVDASYAALAIEAFHTASLIADDLPCMDNDDERRNQPSLHKKYDETTALLASYAMIAAGYELVSQNSLQLNDPERGLIAIQITSKNTGLHGATGGQYLDINPPHLTKEVILDVIQKKTVSLFEIAFSYGWIFGGGDLKSLPLVKKASEHFGMAFQITDDIGDTEQDIVNGRQINLANFLGHEEATKMFHVELKKFEECVGELGLGGSGVAFLEELLSHR
ncbi:MAG: Farnesyl diphosphate synthase [Chlamydiae bacterium]|nr:Farnesyl diphosphate synthase [Chlamydiota bacterium]